MHCVPCMRCRLIKTLQHRRSITLRQSYTTPSTLLSLPISYAIYTYSGAAVESGVVIQVSVQTCSQCPGSDDVCFLSYFVHFHDILSLLFERLMASAQLTSRLLLNCLLTLSKHCSVGRYTSSHVYIIQFCLTGT